MNKGLGLLLILLVLIGCKRESNLPPLSPDEFTTGQREQLGRLLSDAIFTNHAEFPIRSINSPQDSILYDYLQRLYDQASYFHHFDPFATPENEWRASRLWKIHLVEKEQLFAFTLPGGDHFISTGLLKKLLGADQLFALLALETTRMQYRFLFFKLVEKFNTNRMLEIIESGEAGNGILPKDLIDELFITEYDAEIAQQLDEATLQHICQSSVFDPEGLANIDELFAVEFPDWITRKSYAGRVNYINNLLETMGATCGDRGDQGDYQTFVLDNL